MTPCFFCAQNANTAVPNIVKKIVKKSILQGVCKDFVRTHMVQYRIGNIKIYYRMEDDVRKDFKAEERYRVERFLLQW